MFSLEVFVVVVESRSLKPVGGCTGSVHTIGHSWGSAGEHSNTGKEDVLFLEVIEELVEVRTTKVGDGTQSSEQTLARQLLEVTLTDVLQRESYRYSMHSYTKLGREYSILTNMVVRRSNLSKN